MSNEHMTLAEALEAKRGTTRTKPQQREQAEQIALFGWRDAHKARHPRLKWLHASLNGVPLGSVGVASKAKRAGLTKGVWDVFLPGHGIRGWEGGLYVEMKAERPDKAGGNRTLTPEQSEFMDDMSPWFCFETCYTAQEAVTAICDYLGITDERVRTL